MDMMACPSQRYHRGGFVEVFVVEKVFGKPSQVGNLIAESVSDFAVEFL